LEHSFLLDAGRWILEGTWLEKDNQPISVKGRTVISWSPDNWFIMVTKLTFPDNERDDISFQYKGHFRGDTRQYTYLLQQSILGSIEGEGWIGQQSIIQRYWVLGDRQKRGGFETFYRLSDNTYGLASAILSGGYLASTMEGILERQS
jgi:hypothetical protein